MRSDITPGATFPDYELPDHTNTMRRLSELQRDNPLVLTLARGHYYPKEHQQHLQLAAFYSQFAVAYTQMATISTDDYHASQDSVRQSARSGRSCTTRSAPCSGTSTFRSTPTRSTTR